jgi:hypothetical protein
MRSSKVRRKRRSGEIKLAHRVSIYRGRGDSFEKISRDDRCAFPGGAACTLRHSEGDVFYRIVESFSWKWINGVNLLPRGAGVGDLDKNHSPSKIRRY